MTKYQATRCHVDGFWFDSELERDCYLILKDLHDRGSITTLYLQHNFPLFSQSNERVGNCRIDFLAVLPSGQQVAVEAKGMSTAIWRWKEKHFRADYPNIRLMVINRENIGDIYTIAQEEAA